MVVDQPVTSDQSVVVCGVVMLMLYVAVMGGISFTCSPAAGAGGHLVCDTTIKSSFLI